MGSSVYFSGCQNNHYLTMEVQNNAHKIQTTRQNLLATVKQFGFTEEDLDKWLTSPSTFIDVGTRAWPGTYLQENIIFWKASNKQDFFFVGNAKRYTMQDFLMMSFGSYAQNLKLMHFYTELINTLPQQILEMPKKSPVYLYCRVRYGRYLSTGSSPLSNPVESSHHTYVAKGRFGGGTGHSTGVFIVVLIFCTSNLMLDCPCFMRTNIPKTYLPSASDLLKYIHEVFSNYYFFPIWWRENNRCGAVA